MMHMLYGSMDVFREAFLTKTFEMSTNANTKHEILCIKSMQYFRIKKGLS